MRFTTIRLNLRRRRLRHEIAHCFVGMTITNPQKMDCYIFAGFVVQWYKYCQIRSKSHLAVHLYYNRGILSIHEWRNIFVDICFPNHRPDVPHLRALSSLFLLLGTISLRSCLFFTLSALSSAIEQLLHAPHWILFQKITFSVQNLLMISWFLSGIMFTHELLLRKLWPGWGWCYES